MCILKVCPIQFIIYKSPYMSTRPHDSFPFTIKICIFIFGYGKIKNISLCQVLWEGEVLLFGVTTSDIYKWTGIEVVYYTSTLYLMMSDVTLSAWFYRGVMNKANNSRYYMYSMMTKKKTRIEMKPNRYINIDQTWQSI